MTNGYCKSPGSEPYTPTKLEWLDLVLNVNHSVDEFDRQGYSISYGVDSMTDTVVILVYYFEKVNRQDMNDMINLVRTHVKETVERYGWDSWIKIREKLQLIEIEK
jgi:hypothetical protein